MFSRNKKNDEYVIIIGCGRLGANLANTLSDDECNVLIIDDDKNSFDKLSPSYGGLTLTGDATDIDILIEAQINKATVVVSVTNDDNTNIMVAQIVKELFKVKRVITRLYDPDRKCVYQEFGIDTICPAILSVQQIHTILDNMNKEVISI